MIIYNRAQDYDVIWGIYSPYRHGMPKSFQYDYKLPIFDGGKAFRWGGFLKDRLAGLEGVRIPLYCNGANFYFEELPSPKSLMEKTDNILNYPNFKTIQ